MSNIKKIENLVGAYFKLDDNLAFFAPGFFSSTKATENDIPWIGMKNLNRIVYLTLTLHYFFYQSNIADLSLTFDKSGKEVIVEEIRDHFVELIQLEKKSSLSKKIEQLPTNKMLLIRDLFKFAKTKYSKFNDFYENDPNIKMLSEHDGPLSEPLFITDKNVYNYYDKMAKTIFAK